MGIMMGMVLGGRGSAGQALLEPPPPTGCLPPSPHCSCPRLCRTGSFLLLRVRRHHDVSLGPVSLTPIQCSPGLSPARLLVFSFLPSSLYYPGRT